jgi:allophanate hydrolase subunit 1
MTPKEKAIQLVDKFENHSFEDINRRISAFSSAKQCALIAVDEIISQMLSLMKVFNEDRSEFEAIELDYLTKVKQEIELL